MKRKHKIGFLLPLMLLVFFSTVFTAPGIYGRGKVEIDYWTGWGGVELEEVQRLIEREFNAKSKTIKVNVVTIFGNYEKLLTAFASGSVPDVTSAVWDYQLAALASKGALMPLDKQISASKINLNDFWPDLVGSCRYDGKIYGIAPVIDTGFIAYNKYMFRQAGLDPNTPPRSFDELFTYAKRLTKFRDDGSIEVLGFQPIDPSLWAKAFGATFYDAKNRRILATEPELMNALNWMVSFYDHFDLTSLRKFNSGLGNKMSVENPLLSGRLAMDASGEFIVSQVQKYNPKFEYGYFPYPTIDGKGLIQVGGSKFVIPAAATHPAQAWEFIEWMVSPRTSMEMAMILKNTPSRITPAFSPSIRKLIPPLEMTLPLLKDGRGFAGLTIPVGEKYMTELAKAVEYVKYRRKTIEKALQDVQRVVQREWDMANR